MEKTAENTKMTVNLALNYGGRADIVAAVRRAVPAHLPVAMTDDDAERTVDAVARHRDALARVIVHCDAGVSRSPAVALALGRWLGADTRELSARYRPNPHVLETMERAIARRRLSS